MYTLYIKDAQTEANTHTVIHTHTHYPTTCNKQKGQREIFSKTGMRGLSQPRMRFNGSSTSPSNKNCWERILLKRCGLSPPVGLAMNKFKHSNLDDLEPFDQQWKHIETLVYDKEAYHTHRNLSGAGIWVPKIGTHKTGLPGHHLIDGLHIILLPRQG